MLPVNRHRLLILTILAIPSLWMLAAIRPLWRDVDAYVQVTQALSYSTIVQFSALYCFPARLPLYLGQLFEHKIFHLPVGRHDNLFRPTLTDSGTFLLVLLQHGFLLAAQFQLVRAISRRAVVQIIVAVLLAANASFYAFANSVGAEAVSLSALLLLCAFTFRIFQQRRISRTLWIGYFIALSLCVILRHINGVLPSILPGALLFLFLVEGRALQRRWPRYRRYIAAFRRKLGTSLGLGAASIALAIVFEHGLCHLAHVAPNSIAGIAFSWRLDFYPRLAPADRSALLARIRAKTNDPVLWQMLDCIPLGVTANNTWDMEPFEAALHRIPLPHTGDNPSPGDELKSYHNRFAALFMKPPDPALLSAVWTDFGGVWRTTPAHVAVAPFYASLYYFDNPDRVKRIGPLSTFSRPNARAEIIAESRGPYINLYSFSYALAAGFWAVLAVVSCRSSAGRRALCFTLAAVGTGALLEWMSVLFTVFEYRYTLPLWALLFSAILVQAVALFEGARSHTSRRRPAFRRGAAEER